MPFLEVTGCDLRELVRAAYDLSVPQGLGFLHAKDGPLDSATVEEIVGASREHNDMGLGANTYPPNVRLSMDYVHGRACKMQVYQRPGDRWFISARWYDHTSTDLTELLARIDRDDAPRFEEIPA